MSIGPFIRNIRVQKGISQAEVCHDILTQSNYSKFELGKIDIASSALLEIINNLEINFDEFFHLYDMQNDNNKNKFIDNFFNLTFNEPEQLLIIRNEAKKILNTSKQGSPIIQDIINLTFALESISKEQNYEKAALYADPIWKRLQKRDRWYIREIMILNAILYIFPIETADEIIKRSSSILDDYKNNYTFSILKINICINGSLLHIKDNNYETALYYLNTVINLSKRPDHFLLKKIAEFRKSYCNAHIGNQFIENLPQVIMYFISIDKIPLYESLKSEAEKYCSNPEFLIKVNKLEQQILAMIP